MKKQPNTPRHPELVSGSGKKTAQESGSIMLEVIAVLAILAVITPIIYQQAYRRNLEISNVNIASEMRSVKEAVQAYITAACPSNMQSCNLSSTNVAAFMPDGLEDITGQYTIIFCDYSVGVLGNESLCSATLTSSVADANPVAKRRYALVIDGNPPSNWNLRRARRVATLVGTDAGVCMGSSGIAGVNGAWSLPYTCAANNVVVHTGLNIWQ